MISEGERESGGGATKIKRAGENKSCAHTPHLMSSFFA